MKGESVSTKQLLGTVLAVQANFYRVQMDEESGVRSQESGVRSSEERKKNKEDKNFSPAPCSLLPAPILLCTRRTRLKKIGQQVMVGDRVIVEEPDWAGGRGAVGEVLPRHSLLNRPAIANVNQILLVFAVADPPLEPIQLSRFLIKAESTGVDVLLCLNKCDLVCTHKKLISRSRNNPHCYKSNKKYLATRKIFFFHFFHLRHNNSMLIGKQEYFTPVLRKSASFRFFGGN